MQILEMPAIDHLRDMLSEIEVKVNTFSLADAIREGATVTEKATDSWYDAENNQACALSAALISARARGLV